VANLVSVERASLALGTAQVLDAVSLGVGGGDRIGVVGRNGGGKTTLLRVLEGAREVDTGRVARVGHLTIGVLTQDDGMDPSATVHETVIGALPEHFWAADARIRDVLTGLLGGTDAPAVGGMSAPVGPLSGGERRRVALAALLVASPDLLLLDEPTNHLDAESVWWLERFLAEFKGTVVAVTHDRYFLDNVAGWILELYQGAGIPWEGNYSSWLDQKQRRLAQEEKQASARQKTLQRELEWVRLAPRARQAKSKARITRYEELREEAERQTEGTAEILIPVPDRLGDEVVVATDVSKGFGDRLLFENLTFALPRGGIVGVIGPNGAGKTTLFRMITGQEQPDSGTLTVGSTVHIAYVDQSRDALDGDNTVYQEISGGQDQLQFGRRTVNARAYAAGFNFRGADQQKKVGTLSGGERNRLHLAKLLKSGGNLLLLDEPTNDLDVDTLRALEEALLGFAGCAVVISHDRWFLDRIATHILAFEGNSEAVWFEGNYADYAADLKRRKGVDANQPHRIRYKKLVH